MTTYKEANRENLKIWQKEPEAFAKMLLDFNSLQLKRIDISGDRNEHSHNGLVDGKQYLVCYDGRWSLSRASNYNGRWDFRLNSYSVHLRGVDIVFEVTNLPEVEKNPLGKVVQDECEEVGTNDCYYLCSYSTNCKFLDEYES